MSQIREIIIEELDQSIKEQNNSVLIRPNHVNSINENYNILNKLILVVGFII